MGIQSPRDGSQKVANNIAIECNIFIFLGGEILHSCKFMKIVNIHGFLTFLFPDFEIYKWKQSHILHYVTRRLSELLQKSVIYHHSMSSCDQQFWASILLWMIVTLTILEKLKEKNQYCYHGGLIPLQQLNLNCTCEVHSRHHLGGTSSEF